MKQLSFWEYTKQVAVDATRHFFLPFQGKKKPLSVTLKTGFAGTASGVEITIRAYQQPYFFESSWGRMSEEQSLRVLNGLAEDSRQAIVRGLSSYQQVGPAEFAEYSRDKEGRQ